MWTLSVSDSERSISGGASLWPRSARRNHRWRSLPANAPRQPASQAHAHTGTMANKEFKLEKDMSIKDMIKGLEVRE